MRTLLVASALAFLGGTAGAQVYGVNPDGSIIINRPTQVPNYQAPDYTRQYMQNFQQQQNTMRPRQCDTVYSGGYAHTICQ